jgi:acyl carrier protein
MDLNSSDELEVVVRRVFSLAAGMPEETVTTDVILADLQIDSISAATMAMLLEEELGIQVSQARLVRLLSLDTVSDFIRALGE